MQRSMPSGKSGSAYALVPLPCEQRSSSTLTLSQHSARAAIERASIRTSSGAIQPGVTTTKQPEKAGQSGYGEVVTRLQEIVESLEGGQLSLEVSLEKFAEGVQLVK